MMKTNRREFLGYTAASAAAVSTGIAFSSAANAEEIDPNQEALAALEKIPFANSVMPSMFTPVVDATGFENHNK